MTPKEKASYLFKMFFYFHRTSNQPKYKAIDSAIFLCEELILSTCVSCKILSEFDKYDRQYWQLVKKELEQLELNIGDL